MNQPTKVLLDAMLKALGSESTSLGNASLGLCKAPFTPTVNLAIADITEANYSGYARQGLGTTTTTFTGGDGKEYVEFTTLRFQPTDTVTVNTVYGLFLVLASDTTKLADSDAFTAPIPMSGPSNQITITPRFGLDPAANYGLNVISN